MATGEVRSKSADPGLILTKAGNPPLPLYLPKGVRLRVSPAVFWRLCCANRDLRLERTATGRLIVMAPAGFATGGRNMKLGARLNNWAEANGTGAAYDATTGYILPNGATRSPDASWISQARSQLIPLDQREKFPHACPEFVAELRSPSDRLKSIQRKMREYIDQGVLLGWLLDPFTGRVEIYRAGREVEVLDRPVSLSGEDVLPGFVLDLRGILGD